MQRRQHERQGVVGPGVAVEHQRPGHDPDPDQQRQQCASAIKPVPGARDEDRGMSERTDTFTAFVDLLADALDDHEATAEELAARLYLSRFHLDRIVSQVAGEPPRRFRRRILLERAAYRLLSTDRTVLDIAVEAGYGSHEAFTRAFTQAYGAPPAAWRRRPRAIRIEAPSGVHFHPPGSIRLPSRDKVSSMDLLTRMVEHHVWLTGEILAKASRLSEAQLDEPIELNVDDDPDRPSVRRLLSRLIGQMGMWNAALANREYDWSVEEHEPLDSMRRRLAEEGPVYLAHVRRVVEEGRLDETFVDALCEPAEVFTYGGMIAHVLTFAAHRRTLAVLALDKHGITDLGWGDPMRWVAQPTG
jgi:AraC family transcriptional regulator